MIKNVQPLSSNDLIKGLVTRADFLKSSLDQTPNCMDIKWYFDGAFGKRFGSSSSNSLIIGSTSAVGWIIDSNNTLSTNLISYWKLDEASGSRVDSIGNNILSDLNSCLSVIGIRGQSANPLSANSSGLFIQSANILTSSSNFSISTWVYINATDNAGHNLIVQGHPSFSNQNFQLIYAANKFSFIVTSDGSTQTQVDATSLGTILANSWYNVIGWHSNNSHIGISVNLSQNTLPFTNTNFASSSGFLALGFHLTSSTANSSIISQLDGRIDETGIWGKVLSLQERKDLYAGGSGNTYSAGNTSFAWASFDFGASSIRWLMVSAGTGLYASSNLGSTFVVIGTTRTQTYQYMERSKNVLIATSDAYDPPLYWAGSAGTFAAILAPNSAPSVKYNINYNGFLILLNSSSRKRGFFYDDESLQLTDPWTNSFDLPSSADDEITSAFILYKFLYVSTRYKIYRLAYVGGNPDWSYLKVKDWGFVPRTVAIVPLQGGGTVAVGVDWDRRVRMFDGFDDRIISDNVENNNGLCDFSLQKVSYAGSGLIISHAVFNPLTQEYRLNVAIGSQSSQTTHSLILNTRTLSFYPYSNQQWQTMCVAESNNQRALIACDRSGFVYILDSGNLDKGVTPINEIYDSPPLFSGIPESVSKGKQLNLFFTVGSCGTLFYRDRIDFSNQWSSMSPLTDQTGASVFTGTENLIKIRRMINTPATYNTYQFQITSSAGTANPWKLDRIDFLQQGLGIGIGH